MYRHHFGLREKPFQIAPSPRFLFPSETHDESRARILYGIEDNRGFVVVYGRVGLGKTTVLLSVLEELDAKTRTALIYQPVTSFYNLLRMCAHEFGLGSENRDEVNLIWDLNEFFIQRLSEGEKCVLIIDEAQNLSLEILEKLRTLSNLQTENASLLQIVLVGQPELYDKLSDPRLLQLRQRVGVWHEIEALDQEETTDYILHRLHRAGARRPKDIFSVKVCERVHRLSGGVPRVVNQVCDTALMIAFGKEIPKSLKGRWWRLRGSCIFWRKNRSSKRPPSKRKCRSTTEGRSLWTRLASPRSSPGRSGSDLGALRQQSAALTAGKGCGHRKRGR